MLIYSSDGVCCSHCEHNNIGGLTFFLFIYNNVITFVVVTVYMIVLEASLFLLIYSNVITLVIIIANVTMIDAKRPSQCKETYCGCCVIFPIVSGTLFFATMSKPALGTTLSSVRWGYM